MRDRISRLFRLRPEEAGTVLIMAFVLLSNATARQVTGIVAISGLISEGGVNQVLVVWLIDYIIILFTGGLQSLIVDRIDRLTLIKGMVFALALVFSLTRLMFTFGLPNWFNYGLLYILAEQQFIFFPLVFWVLANDIFDMSQAKRVFPFIASWSFVGVLLGTGISAISPGFMKFYNIAPENVLWLNVFFYLAIFLLLVFGLRHVKIRVTTHKIEPVRETLMEGWEFVKNVPSFRYLMLTIILLAACDVIVEFRFLNITEAVFVTQESYQRFYSLYRMSVTLLAFLVQSTLTSRIIEQMNLKNTFFFLPIVVIIGALGMMVLPGVGMAIFAMASLKLVRDTIDESSRKAFEALVPEERRGRVSTFMDSYLPAIGTVVACLVTGGIILAGLLLDIPDVFFIYLGVAVVGSAAAVYAVFQMRKVYDSSLLNWRLKRRQRGTSVLDKLSF